MKLITGFQETHKYNTSVSVIALDLQYYPECRLTLSTCVC